MREELFVLICTIGLLVGGSTMANATTVTWTLMQDSSMAGVGPGGDDLIGTSDDSTSGQNNNCNFDGGTNCNSSSPTTGSWSFMALELPQTASCLAGNLGDPCTTNADCGDPGVCIPCPDDPSTWDTYSYMGKIVGESLGNGTMKACQETNLFRWTAIKIGSSESISQGTGGTCINLRTQPSAFSSGCGPGASFTSTANIRFSLECNPLLSAAQIDNVAVNGRVYDTSTDIAEADCQCYPKTSAGAADLNAIRTVAAGKGASYLLVLCGNTSIPNDSTTTSACLRGASVWGVVVAYTADNASSCTDADPLCTPSCPCAGGLAEVAQ